MSSREVPHWAAELVLDSRATLGEGPHWHAAAGELLWVDIPAGVVHRFDPATGTDRSFTAGQLVGAAVPHAAGGYALALRNGFATVEETGGALRWLAPVEADKPETRMNDGACDSAGRFWAGTASVTEDAPTGSLYRLAPGGELTAMVSGVTISNGIGWSPDDTVMYYIDTPRQLLEAFDFNAGEGTISGRRQVAAIDPRDGHPDGLTVDADGCIWLALWDGSAVRKYTPTGELAGIVDVPAARPTSCAFGGPELDVLYITTARSTPRRFGRRNGGGVFAARTGSCGFPSHPFAG
jgi:sugar lactone lactonase YvrE